MGFEITLQVIDVLDLTDPQPHPISMLIKGVLYQSSYQYRKNS